MIALCSGLSVTSWAEPVAKPTYPVEVVDRPLVFPEGVVAVSFEGARASIPFPLRDDPFDVAAPRLSGLARVSYGLKPWVEAAVTLGGGYSLSLDDLSRMGAAFPSPIGTPRLVGRAPFAAAPTLGVALVARVAGSDTFEVGASLSGGTRVHRLFDPLAPNVGTLFENTFRVGVPFRWKPFPSVLVRGDGGLRLVQSALQGQGGPSLDLSVGVVAQLRPTVAVLVGAGLPSVTFVPFIAGLERSWRTSTSLALQLSPQPWLDVSLGVSTSTWILTEVSGTVAVTIRP